MNCDWPQIQFALCFNEDLKITNRILGAEAAAVQVAAVDILKRRVDHKRAAVIKLRFAVALAAVHMFRMALHVAHVLIRAFHLLLRRSLAMPMRTTIQSTEISTMTKKKRKFFIISVFLFLVLLFFVLISLWNNNNHKGECCWMLDNKKKVNVFWCKAW